MAVYYARALAHFPLVTYPSSLAPSSPRTEERIILWLVGTNTSAESLDPLSRQLQALARFTGRAVEVRSSEETYLTRDNTAFRGDKAIAFLGTTTVQREQETIHKAYSTLINATLLPALLATIYLSPSPSPSTSTSTAPPAPFLLSLLQIYTAFLSRRETIKQIKKLRLAHGAGEGILELEELEREGVECIRNLEEKFEEQGTPGWFCGNRFAPLRSLLLGGMN